MTFFLIFYCSRIFNIGWQVSDDFLKSINLNIAETANKNLEKFYEGDIIDLVRDGRGGMF